MRRTLIVRGKVAYTHACMHDAYMTCTSLTTMLAINGNCALRGQSLDYNQLVEVEEL